MTDKKYLEWLLWGVVLVWGANYTVGKWGMASFDAFSFNTLRFLIATPILFLLLYVLERNIKVELKDCWELALIGLTGITVYQVLFMMTVKYASATNASLLIAISPVFTAVFAWAVKQEKLGKQGWLGSGMAFLGVFLVILFGANSLATGSDAWRGNIAGMFASAIWGLYPVVARRMLAKYSALKTTTYSALFGALFLLAISFSFLRALPWSEVKLSSWGSLMFSVGPVTAYGLVVWYYGMSKVGVNKVMAYMYSVPLVAVLTAALVLHEQIHILQILGALVIFLGIGLIRRDKVTSTSALPLSEEAGSNPSL